jgi:hypothetical protein
VWKIPPSESKGWFLLIQFYWLCLKMLRYWKLTSCES